MAWDEGSWDMYDSMVVCAANKRDARLWHPCGKLLEQHTYNIWFPLWVVPEDISTLKVTFLGAAKAGLQPGVVRASFNAG
jgi:hypothetical protein